MHAPQPMQVVHQPQMQVVHAPQVVYAQPQPVMYAQAQPTFYQQQQAHASDVSAAARQGAVEAATRRSNKKKRQTQDLQALMSPEEQQVVENRDRARALAAQAEAEKAQQMAADEFFEEFPSERAEGKMPCLCLRDQDEESAGRSCTQTPDTPGQPRRWWCYVSNKKHCEDPDSPHTLFEDVETNQWWTHDLCETEKTDTPGVFEPRCKCESTKKVMGKQMMEKDKANLIFAGRNLDAEHVCHVGHDQACPYAWRVGEDGEGNPYDCIRDLDSCYVSFWYSSSTFVDAQNTHLENAVLNCKTRWWWMVVIWVWAVLNWVAMPTLTSEFVKKRCVDRVIFEDEYEDTGGHKADDDWAFFDPALLSDSGSSAGLPSIISSEGLPPIQSQPSEGEKKKKKKKK